MQLASTVIGVLLIVTWAAYVMVAPYLPERYPISQSRALLLVGLLAQTYAWLVMLMPHDCNGSILASIKFEYAFGGALFWWAVVLAISVYVMAALSVPQIFPRPPLVPEDYA